MHASGGDAILGPRGAGGEDETVITITPTDKTDLAWRICQSYFHLCKLSVSVGISPAHDNPGIAPVSSGKGGLGTAHEVKKSFLTRRSWGPNVALARAFESFPDPSLLTALEVNMQICKAYGLVFCV